MRRATRDPGRFGPLHGQLQRDAGAGACPGRLQPPNGPVLQWLPVDGARNYTVAITPTSGGGTSVSSQITVASAYAAQVNFVTGSYQWTVTARDAGNNVIGSATSTFTVDNRIQVVQAAQIQAPGGTGVGQVITSAPPAWSQADVTNTYQWLRDGTRISGATADTYTLITADFGRAISLQVTGRSPASPTGVASATSWAPRRVAPRRPSTCRPSREFLRWEAVSRAAAARGRRLRYPDVRLCLAAWRCAHPRRDQHHVHGHVGRSRGRPGLPGHRLGERLQRRGGRVEPRRGLSFARGRLAAARFGAVRRRRRGHRCRRAPDVEPARRHDPRTSGCAAVEISDAVGTTYMLTTADYRQDDLAARHWHASHGLQDATSMSNEITVIAGWRPAGHRRSRASAARPPRADAHGRPPAPGRPPPASHGYQWLRPGAPIRGATTRPTSSRADDAGRGHLRHRLRQDHRLRRRCRDHRRGVGRADDLDDHRVALGRPAQGSRSAPSSASRQRPGPGEPHRRHPGASTRARRSPS